MNARQALGRLVLLLLFGASCFPQSGLPAIVAAIPAGFIDENVVRINEVVDLAFVGHMMLAVSKQGTVHRFNVSDPNAVDA